MSRKVIISALRLACIGTSRLIVSQTEIIAIRGAIEIEAAVVCIMGQGHAIK